MRRFVGACGFAFNRALVRQNEYHELRNKAIIDTNMASWRVVCKADAVTPWMEQALYQPGPPSLQEVERASERFLQQSPSFLRCNEWK